MPAANLAAVHAPNLLPPAGLSKLTPEMAAACNKYLSDHHLSAVAPNGPGLHVDDYVPSLDDSATTVPAIVQALLPLTLLDPTDELTALVTGRYVPIAFEAAKAVWDKMQKAARDGLQIGSLGVDAPSVALPEGKAQFAVQSAINYAVHANVDGSRPDTPSDYTMQITVGKTVPHHPDGESGTETQYQIQFGYNFTNGQPSVLAGVQESYVMSLFNGIVQASAFIQALYGISVGGTIKGSFKLNPATQLQPSAGAQLTLQLGPVQVFVQPSISVTDTTGQPSTQDRNITGGIGFQF